MPWITEDIFINSENALLLSPHQPPLVSIVIPVFNGSQFLHRAITSALEQKRSYPNIEVLVVNDGSTDGGKTREIANSFHSTIRYFEKENGGVSSALNLGIDKMKGDFFSWLSHDDFYTDDRFSRLAPLLSRISDDTLLSHDYLLVDEKEHIIRPVTLLSDNVESFPYFMLKGCYFSGCALIIPKKLLLQQQGFRQDLRFTQDLDAWARLSLVANLVHLKANLTCITSHSHQGSVVHRQALTSEERLILPAIVNSYLKDTQSWLNATKAFNFKTENHLAIFLFHYYREVRRNSVGANAVIEGYRNALHTKKIDSNMLSRIYGNLFLFIYYGQRFYGILIKTGINGICRSIKFFLLRRFG